MADINKNTPNPPGGTFDRDAERRSQRPRHRPGAGRASTESASGRFTDAEQTQRGRDGLAYISKQFVRYGVTSVHHEAAICSPCSRCGRAATCCIA
jgi:predicted amidohydrolase YtcJ